MMLFLVLELREDLQKDGLGVHKPTLLFARMFSLGSEDFRPSGHRPERCAHLACLSGHCWFEMLSAGQMPASVSRGQGQGQWCSSCWPVLAGRAPGLCSGLAGRGVLAVLALLCKSDTTLRPCRFWLKRSVLPRTLGPFLLWSSVQTKDSFNPSVRMLLSRGNGVLGVTSESPHTACRAQWHR